MKKQLEQYFGCEVKIAEYKNQLSLPIFMTIRDITIVEIYGVNFAVIDVRKETALSVAAMKKQKAKYEEVLRCPIAYEVALNSVSMRNALVKNGVSFVDLPGNVFLPVLGIVLQDVYTAYYTIIGGTACDILLTEAELSFRATKDVDMILVMEDNFSEFATIFWE